MTDTVQAAENAIVEDKKVIEKEVHPIVKTLWEDFTGDLEEFKVWIKKEVEKL